MTEQGIPKFGAVKPLTSVYRSANTGGGLANLKMVTRAVGKLMLVCALATVVGTSSAQALSLQPIGSGFEAPVYVTSDPGNPERLFVVEREGTITLLENGALKPFADLRSVVVENGEGG